MIELNTKNRAATQTTLAFNSMCHNNDSYLGASDDGLFFIVSGQSDNGVKINSLVKSGAFDAGSERIKRARFIYIGYEATGDLKFSWLCDSELAGEYDIPYVGTGRHYRRMPISRAHQFSYLEWQIENVDGCFFKLYSVDWLPVFV